MYSNPEVQTLYQIIQKNYLSTKKLYQSDGGRIPGFVDSEFHKFLKCGILSHGFARFYCKECKENKLVAFSCKKRGFCPRCLSKRMSIFAAHINDRVIPEVPVRQWVVSLPYELRYLLAFKSERTSGILKIINKEISKFYKDQISNKKLLNPQTGSVTVIQRFGSALNLNTHFHILFMDGVYVYGKQGSLKFQKSIKPTDEKMTEVLRRIFEKTKKLLEEEYHSYGDMEFDLEKALRKMSIDYKIGLGERAGQKIPFVFGEETSEQQNLCIQFAGFSMHAKTRVKSNDRAKLEKMCRYLSRPPIAKDRLFYSGGKVIYQLKTPYANGAKAVVYTPNEFIEKLAMLIPEPKKNLIRYHGVFAPNSKFRTNIVKESPKRGEKRIYNRSWSEMMKRVFEEEVLECACGGKFKLIALIEEELVIKAILESLNIPYQLARFEEARGSPRKSDHFADYNQETSNI